MIRSERKQRFDSSQVGWTLPLIIACITVAGSSSFSFGYGIGGPNMYTQFTEPFLRKQFNICDVDNAVIQRIHNCSYMPKVKSDFSLKKELINGLPQTIFLAGCFIGSLTGSMWSNIGPWWTRRNVFFVNLPIAYFAGALLIMSHYFKIITFFYLSRLLHGYQSGMACCIVPPYINEISPQKLRGSAGVIHQLFVTVGILCAQFIGLSFILAKYQYWSIGMSLMIVPCLIANFVIFWIPQSPSEMLIKFNREDKAVIALQKLRSVRDVSSEIEALEQQNSSNRSSSVGIKQLFTDRTLLWPTITSLTLLIVQAMSGINAVFFYSSKIFRTAGIKDENLQYTNIFTGIINMSITILVIPLIERLGRRPLIIYPMCSMLMIFVFMTISIQYNEHRQLVGLGYGSVILTMLFICAFALSLGPISFIYPNEVFRLEARDSILRVGLCLNYACNLLVSLCFPAINMKLKGYVFVIFFVVILLSLLILWWKMPETKNKTIEEIESFWNIRRKSNFECNQELLQTTKTQ